MVLLIIGIVAPLSNQHDIQTLGQRLQRLGTNHQQQLYHQTIRNSRWISKNDEHYSGDKKEKLQHLADATILSWSFLQLRYEENYSATHMYSL
jgi:hypothetical protein